jgi:cysteinyl-tRNA synthetase
VEEFKPLDPPRVRIYTCGPTVYDYAHIGNFRTFVFQDILRRHLRARGFNIEQVMNITDVDDRIIANAAAAGLSLRDYTEKFTQAFLDDMRMLNLESPEKTVRATDHIDDMVQLMTGREAHFQEMARFISASAISPMALSKIDRWDSAWRSRQVDRYERPTRDFALEARKPGNTTTPLGAAG